MSTEPETIEDETPKDGKKKLLIVALTVGLVVGAAAGSLVVGPLVAEGPAKSKPAAKSDGADCSAMLAAHGVSLAPASVHTIDNVVLNPAQSGGTRYLMANTVLLSPLDLHWVIPGSIVVGPRVACHLRWRPRAQPLDGPFGSVFYDYLCGPVQIEWQWRDSLGPQGFDSLE